MLPKNGAGLADVEQLCSQMADGHGKGSDSITSLLKLVFESTRQLARFWAILGIVSTIAWHYNLNCTSMLHFAIWASTLVAWFRRS